jgi:hypothetical protein
MAAGSHDAAAGAERAQDPDSSRSAVAYLVGRPARVRANSKQLSEVFYSGNLPRAASKQSRALTASPLPFGPGAGSDIQTTFAFA